MLAKFSPRAESTYPFGYVPHLDEAIGWSDLLAPVCEQMGVRYIDPRDEVGAVSMPWAACR